MASERHNIFYKIIVVLTLSITFITLSSILILLLHQQLMVHHKGKLSLQKLLAIQFRPFNLLYKNWLNYLLHGMKISRFAGKLKKIHDISLGDEKRERRFNLSKWVLSLPTTFAALFDTVNKTQKHNNLSNKTY